jgi:L-fucose isomerase-like protein
MQPIVVVPFASEVHGKEYYANVLEVLRKHLMRYGIDFHRDIVTSAEKAEEAGKKYSDFLPIAIVLTGGTSNLIYRFANAGGMNRVILLAHSEHNSLASAISARSKLEREGIAAGLYWCEEYYSIECENTVDRMMRVARAVAAVVNSKIAVVGDKEKDEVMEAFETRFEATVDIVTFDQLKQLMDSVSSDRVSEAIKEIEESISFEASKQALEKVARLYIALDEIAKKGYDAVAIDCFPFILKHGVTPCIPLAMLNKKGVIAACEADIPATFGMMIAKALTGRSGWIANSVSFRGRTAMFAHCTIALDIVKGRAKAVEHFETSAPYAVLGELDNAVVTLMSVDRDFTAMLMERGRVIKSGLLTYAACRTQAMIELDIPADVIPRLAPANHHVVLLGDWVEELRDIAYMLNIDAATYRELLI